jgi:oligoendopeptidase F
MKLCKVGGTQSFLGLIKTANLKSPFEEGCVSSITDLVEKTLDLIPDSSL